MPTTRVAVCQYAIDIDDPAGTLKRLRASVAEAAEAEPQVIVLPELCTSGYVFHDIAEAQSRAEPVDGPTVQLFRELSFKHHAIVVGGFCERSDGDRPFNSAAVVENGEVLVVYRKTHLWGTEKLIFTAGDEPAPVVNTSVGKIAVMICYDAEFPEMVGSVARRGAQLVLAPSNWPALKLPPPPGERAPEVVKAQAFAAVNRVFTVVADRIGSERGVDWIGGSVICNVWGYPMAGPANGDALVLWADLDLNQAFTKAVGVQNNSFEDRRPELY
ncbi:nitrilase-related carbon-nitrogen hydrolase [Microlunatus antarcticus]|uniref:Putative amidohydrolase n=1 Tax=Microlunatus antarcticus TaxID=53388 RepID=A0A7W5P5W2_9ACTN|nr:putative amidohydrolase [Microlunatus antarcticus]